MARRHAAAGSIVVLVLLMLVVMWPQVAAAQDEGQDQAHGQDGSGAVTPRLFLPLASNKGQLQSTPDTSIWSDTAVPAVSDSAQRWVVPDAYRLINANMERLDAVLAQAPAETQAGVATASSAPTVLELPLPNGTLQRFTVVESPIMAPELAASYPEITTYEARGIDDPTAVARLDRTPAGFHAMILSGSDTVFIDPYLRGSDTLCASYYRSDYGNYYGKQRNELEPLAGPPATETPVNAPAGINAAQSGPTMRTYRLALAADGEYTQFYGGTVANALAGMTTTINRVTGIYRRDLGIQFQLIANTDKLIYTDPNTDPYTDFDSGALLDQNQANIDAVIGSANYDIGHVFTTGGGGLAGLGVVCNNLSKAQGETGSSAPIGDAYDVDYVAHEIGHQFNANHTFNNNTIGSCAGNRSSSTAFEPGSGSTIMAYAGICISQNLQGNSDDQFSAISIAEINAYSTAGNGSSCPAITNTGNSAPTVNAGPSFTIPRQTPFTLTGAGSDPDGNGLTYSWEQLDLGNAWAIDGVLPNTDADGSARPIFRVYRPVASPARTFPALSSILSGSNSNIGEALPQISRSMKFRLTARDGLGGVNNADTTVTVSAGSGPFAVTAPNTAVSWNGGDSQTVTWNVANTTAAPVNCATVNILLSSDGGQSFPTTLAANTPNDGSEAITVPGVNTTTGRVKVACAGNIFFDIGDANVTVVSATNADLGIAMSDAPDPVNAGSALTYQINVTNGGPADTQAVAVVDTLPAGVTLASATSSLGSCSGTTTVTCTIGSLANGGSASVTIVVNVDPALVRNAGGPTTITNSAGVSGQPTDPNGNNNSAAATTAVAAQADLAITSFGPVAPPAQVTVGQDTALVLRKVITNLGPSAPIDAALTWTGTGPADTTVTPPTGSDQALALELNEQRTLDENYTVRCNAAGDHTFTFTTQIQPAAGSGTDSSQGNNTANANVTVTCVAPVAQADLAITSFGPVAPPKQVLVGQDVALVLRKVITNLGPTAPVDAALTWTGTSPADTAVTPAAGSCQALALALNEQRKLDENYSVRCSAAGTRAFTFTSIIQPLQGSAGDANQTNNTKSVIVKIECVVPVAVNIKPGSNPNSINTHSNGVIPVGILTTKAGEYNKPLAFDAAKIDPRSVRFGTRGCIWTDICGASVTRRSWSIQDVYELDEVTKDGDLDLMLNFLTYDVRLPKGTTEACVKGKYTDATGASRTFFGCDSVRMIN